MSEILQNTGVTLWSIRDDYDELQTSVFEALTGTGGKSNIRLIDEAIGNINSKLNGYYFEYSDDRLYICKKSENENIKRYPVTLNDNNGHIASKVDGSTITIDENGIVRGLPVDDALSSISTNPIQNKVVKAKVDEIEKNVSKNTEDIKKNVTNISNNTQKITSLETAVSLEKTRAESVENQLKTDIENGKKVWDDKYTKSEVDNKFSTLETNIDWKEAVSTFDDIATTYPTPDDGWTVNVKDTDYTYRYNGTKWVAISANAIPKATNEVDGLMTKEYVKKLDGLTKYTPDGTTITADEDGTLHGADTIQVDGITITRDDATKVIALAKTLQDKIALVDNKIDKTNVANNLTTTEADFVLDARQGKALQDQLTTLNGSLNNKADSQYFSHDTINTWIQTPLHGAQVSRTYAAFNDFLGAFLGTMLVDGTGMVNDFAVASSKYGFVPTVVEANGDLNDVLGNRFIEIVGGAQNTPHTGANFYGLNISWVGNNDFAFQLLIAPNEEQISGKTTPRMYMRSKNAGTWTKWYVIAGTLLS